MFNALITYMKYLYEIKSLGPNIYFIVGLQGFSSLRFLALECLQALSFRRFSYRPLYFCTAVMKPKIADAVITYYAVCHV